MNTRNLYLPLLTALLAVGSALNFSACSEQTPMQPDATTTRVSVVPGIGKRAVETYVQNSSMLVRKANNQESYRGGRMSVPNGSYFFVDNGAYTPPAGTTPNADVELTMTVIRDEVGLHYEFGPHGSQFDPPAELWFDWHELGSKKATLYYIDDEGDWIAQQPDFDDKRGKRFMLLINHFSRYAVAHGQ